MSVIPTISADGVGVVAAGQLNAYQISALNTATLRSLTGQTGMTAFLQGTYVPNDGGQGLFWWNYASVARDDNSTIIVPYGATAGAWNRINLTSLGSDVSNATAIAKGTTTSRTIASFLGDIVSVKDFGAKGDGTTDDTAAIQAALNLGPYHAVYFPSGTYICANLTCGNDITLYGDGLTNSQLVLKAGSTGPILTATNAVHLTLKDLGFSGNYTNCPSGTNCVVITGMESGGNGFWIDSCGFFNAKTIGLYQTGTYSKARISNCVAEGNQLDGIVANAVNLILEGNRCVANGRFGILSQGNWGQILGNTCASNGQLVTGGAGIGVLNCSYSIVANNNCIANGTGAYFTHGIQLNTTNNSVVDGNFSEGNNGSGIDIHISAYTTCTGNQSVGNIVRGIENDTTSTYTTIDGNVVYGNYEIGISVFNTIGSIVSNNSVIKNGLFGTATNPLTGVANQPYGLALWGAGSYGNYTVVTNNEIVQNVGSGSNGVGMYVDPACTAVSLLGNSFTANTTQIVSVKSNFFVVRDNFGVVTQQTGTTTLASGATSVAVTFSPALAYAPTASSIVAAFTNMPFTNTGAITITSVSASGFTLNTYTAPGGSGVGIDWSVSVFA